MSILFHTYLGWSSLRNFKRYWEKMSTGATRPVCQCKKKYPLETRKRFRDILSTPVNMIQADSAAEMAKDHVSLNEVAIIFLQVKINALPIVNSQNVLVGIVTQSDIIKYVMETTAFLASNIQHHRTRGDLISCDHYFNLIRVEVRMNGRLKSSFFDDFKTNLLELAELSYLSSKSSVCAVRVH